MFGGTVITALLAAFALTWLGEFLNIGFVRDTLALVFLSTLFAAVPIAFISAHYTLRLRTLEDAVAAIRPTDRVTGVLNREFFEIAMRDEQQRMVASRRHGAVGIFEIDQLAQARSNYGDKFCDEAKRQICTIAHSSLRGPFDKLAVWNDHRFIVLLSDVSIGQAVDICDRLRQLIDDSTVRYRTQTARLTLSFGVSTLEPADSVDDAIEQAEAALKDACRFGRNQVRAA